MNEKMLIPVSILIAGLLVGAGVYFATDEKKPVEVKTAEKQSIKKPVKVDLVNDHIEGGKKAEIFIIEYSDLECPYCKKYNEASKKLVEKYSSNEKVAFVFRAMPLSRHPSAFGEAIATECAAVVGGPEKFFEYKNAIFAETKSDGKFDVNRLPEIATSLSIDKTSFETCLKDKAIAEKVSASFDEAVLAGVEGTPTTFMQLKDGQTYKVPSEFESIDKLIQAYLAQ